MASNPNPKPSFYKWIDPVLAATGQYIEIARLTGLGQGRMLEIGCQDGAYLAQMQEKNWEILGIEPDPRWAESCLQNNVLVLQGTYDEVGVARASFDVVRIRGDLTTTPDPLEMLQFAYEALCPTGYLIAETWNGTGWPIHPNIKKIQNHFTKKSLPALAAQAGFEGGGILAPALGDPVWAPCWKKSKQFPSFWRRGLDRLFGFFDKGSLLVLITQRPQIV